MDAIEKAYNPDEPRIPAGSGKPSGEWTTGAAGGDDSAQTTESTDGAQDSSLLGRMPAPAPSFLGTLDAAQVAELGAYAARMLGPIGAAAAAFGLLFIPSPNNVRVEGEVPEMPGLRYSWNRDETLLHLTYAAPNGGQRIFSAQLDGDVFLWTRYKQPLTEIDANIFPDWEVGDLPVMKGYPPAVARSRIAEIIGHNAQLDEYGLPQREDGYCALAHTTFAARSHRMRLWIGLGDNTLWLKTGDWKVFPDPAIVTFPLFKAALLVIHSIWPSPWACAQAFRANTIMVPIDKTGGYRLDRGPMIPAEPTFPNSIFHIPWIAYLSAPLASDVELPPEIQTERTSDGGLLMIATEERLDPDLPEHAQRARILAETLIARVATGNAGKQ